MTHSRHPRARRLALLGAVLVVSAVSASAQVPERQHDVPVPGLGLRLREGWRLLFHDGCRYAAPATWQVSPDRSRMFAEGASVSVWTTHISNWTARKAQLKAAFAGDVDVHEDSASRLWIESHDAGYVEDYVATVDGVRGCAALIAVRASLPGATDTISAIADSLGPAADWPSALK